MKEKKSISEIVNEKIKEIIKSKKSNLLGFTKSKGKFTSEKKIMTMVNQEMTFRMSEIKKMNYKSSRGFENNGLTIIIEIEDPIENEEIENNLKEYYNSEGCFFQYAEGKDLNYICIGTKI